MSHKMDTLHVDKTKGHFNVFSLVDYLLHMCPRLVANNYKI